ncbi:RagB/SusD family nutrient uptake outer membrane protein [Pedobacter sp. R-06]|uniref:RagB/SusD family nutrient uptake outer membrane protein n=1 Tax=Pedobacter sp. R-06 TaxID=3404051 RepID=UPI003CEAD234
MKAIYNLGLKMSLLIVIVTALTSCKKFLDEIPSKTSSIPVTTTAQLDEILSAYRDFWPEPNKASLFATDDNLVSMPMYDAVPAIYSGAGLVSLQATLWDYTNLANAQRDDFWGGDGFKPGEYGKIFRANMVLEELPKVTGSDEDKARLQAEAHFIRAYSYWNLANVYCLPYVAKNLAEPGLPLKTSTSFEQPLDRATLADTYKLIEADLQEALKIKQTLMQSGKARHWRASTAGVNGFLARFYLNQNNYQKALEYASSALTEYSALVDFNTEMSNGLVYPINIPGVGASTIQFPNQFTTSPTDYTYRISWKEQLYSRYLDGTSYLPSPGLMAMYDTVHDLRYKYNFVEHLSYLLGINYDATGYLYFYISGLPSGPSTAEMYLIKGECQARLGDFNAGLSTVNLLRAKRMTPGTWVNLSAGTQTEAIKLILDERRRELPFVQRWNDLRRYNNNEDPNDDVTITKTFYPFTATAVDKTKAPITYTLDKNSRKYALPINNFEISSSNGGIKQNTY